MGKASLREIPMTLPTKEYDVLVIGGGPAGVGAAIAAGRLGASVLLVERSGCLGGALTDGLQTRYAGLYYHGPMGTTHEILDSESFDRQGVTGNRLLSGIPWEFKSRLEHRNGVWMGPEGRGFWGGGGPAIDPEVAKIVLDEMVLESNVDIRFHTHVRDAVVEKSR
jgi:cation diffusion facilitator CzcD-associated flavoprotein CzcO